jgi:hypothetical protein
VNLLGPDRKSSDPSLFARRRASKDVNEQAKGSTATLFQAFWPPDNDALEEDDAEMNAAGHVGHELGDEVFDGSAGQIGDGAGEGWGTAN